MGARSTVVIACVLAACGVTLDGEQTDDGKSDNGGGGDGSGSGNGSNEDPVSIPATEFLLKFGDKHCELAFACQATFPAGPEAFANTFGANTADCQGRYLLGYQPAIVETEIIAMRIEYDGEAGAECIAGFGPPDCVTIWEDGPDYDDACYDVIDGVVDDGDQCAHDFSCTGDQSYCIDQICTPSP